MARSSHINCKRCHVRRAHKRSKYEMCPPCRMEHRREIEAQRAAAKPRAFDPVREAILDARLDAMPVQQVLSEWHRINIEAAGDLMPKVKPEVVLRKIDPVTVNRNQVGRPPKRVFSDEEKLEIGRMYEEGQTYDQIRQHTNASHGNISQIVRELQLPRRQPRSIDKLEAETRASVPPEVEKAIERMVLPPKPEPILHSTRQPDAWVEWEVRVQGTLIVHESDIESVLKQVRNQYPHLRITGVVQVG